MLWSIVIGFVVGLLARALMPGRDPAGILATTLLGIVGAFVANLIGRGLNLYAENEPAGLLAAVLGAMLVLFIYNRLTARRATHST